MSDKIKNHPLLNWFLCVLLTIIDVIAVIWSFFFGYILFVDYLLTDFKTSDLVFLTVPIICIIGAIMIQKLYFTKFVEGETKDED